MKAPGFTLKDIQTGNLVSLDDYRGKNVMITFWVSWCPDCQRDLPQKDAFYKTLPAETDLAFITINVTGREASTENALKMAREQQWTFPILMDEGTNAYDAYQCTGVPATFLLNQHHEIEASFDDRADFMDIIQSLGTLLK